MLPFRKPSERLKRKLTDDGFKLEDNPLEILRKKSFRWLNTRLGWVWGVFFVAAFSLWVGWDFVSRLPGMDGVATLLREMHSMPRASGDRYSIVIAELGNDKNGAHRRIIDDALRGKFDKEIEVLLPDRTIRSDGEVRPQEAVKAGHARALALLREANANAMIWGEALDDKLDAPIRLHWTVNAEAGLSKSTEKYRPDQANYDLPELFWADLGDVLSLLATSQAAAFSGQSGNYIADQLEPFIKRVSLLIASGKLVGPKQAQLQVILADSLTTFGEQRGDVNSLKKAIAAYRDALKELTREREPLDWAATQNNLGSALHRLGERESRTARLEEAVAAYGEALKESPRERVPLDWAATQNNLGNALQTLGLRENGTARLDAAVASYREALKERTRERVPLDWATTQNNLGSALQKLGERESGTARLDAAVAAYGEALKERTRERVPLDWATTQYNLGNALLVLGERESGTARLEAAVASYREALKERTRERVPLDWAATQSNLGYALRVLGERESGTARLEAAVAAYGEALKERTRERVPLEWAMTQENLEIAEKILAEHKVTGAVSPASQKGGVLR
jgi:tetratricopeptide (TPR) repeat protein